MATRPKASQTVLGALDAELKALRVQAPALAATARALARELDDPGNSATSKSMCARVLADVLGQLRELAPAEVEEDVVDQLRARRESRLAGGAGA